jgi:phosphatidyl-myo-inositol dimannoside synthase
MTVSRRPGRLLFLVTEVCANGGIQRFNQTLLEACSRQDIACDVLSLNDSADSIRARPAQNHIEIVGFSGNRARFTLAVAAAFLKGSHDRVLIGHINFLVLAMMALVLRPVGRPRAMMIAHGIEVWSGIGPLRRIALSMLRQILCVSGYTRKRILEQAPTLRAERLTIFPNALAVTWQDIVPPAAPRGTSRFILSVTRLERGDRYKGVATVIEAFSMLADDSLQYRVVGRGGDLQFLQLVAERCGIKHRMHFMGAVDDRELISLYRDCEAFVLPSGKEGFGIVFLEAMHFGAPVIAAREKGATDVVRDGETGLTVAFGDVIAIKEAIERLMSDAMLRERLRSNGRAMVTNDGPFTFSQFAGRCAEVL